MNKIEIQKALYKLKPTAKLDKIQSGKLYYSCTVDVGDYEYKVFFVIPIEELGDTSFYSEMDAKSLIRWFCPAEE